MAWEGVAMNYFHPAPEKFAALNSPECNHWRRFHSSWWLMNVLRRSPGIRDMHRVGLDLHLESVIYLARIFRTRMSRKKGYVEMSQGFRSFTVFLASLLLLCLPSYGQQTLGAVNGTVADSSGGVLSKVTVKIRNVDTNLEQVASTRDDGSFFVSALPIGRYSVSFARDGFKTEVHDQIM